MEIDSVFSPQGQLLRTGQQASVVCPSESWDSSERAEVGESASFGHFLLSSMTFVSQKCQSPLLLEEEGIGDALGIHMTADFACFLKSLTFILGNTPIKAVEHSPFRKLKTVI